MRFNVLWFSSYDNTKTQNDLTPDAGANNFSHKKERNYTLLTILIFDSFFSVISSFLQNLFWSMSCVIVFVSLKLQRRRTGSAWIESCDALINKILLAALTILV